MAFKRKDAGLEPVNAPIAITAKKDGFRRAGRAHSAQRTIWPAKTFNQAQLAQLQAEPMLVVEVLLAPPEAQGSDNGKDKGPDGKDKGVDGQSGAGDNGVKAKGKDE